MDNFMKASSFVAAIHNPVGPKRKYNVKQLWEKFVEYLQWCDDNPLYRYEIKVVNKATEEVSIPLVRMATVEGFCLYSGVSSPAFYNYKTGELGKGQFTDVCNQIIKTTNEIRCGQAGVDLLNSAFVSKLMGLADVVETRNLNATVTKDELLKISKDLEDNL